MARHQRQLRLGQLAVDDVEIGAAHRARAHLDRHLPGARLGHGKVEEPQRLAGTLEHHRAHGLTLARHRLRSMAEDYRQASLDIWERMANGWSASAPAAAYAEHIGAEPPDPRAPGIFAMATEERTRELLDAAGLRPARIEHVEMEWAFDTSDDHWHYVMDLAGALAMLIRPLPEADQAAVRRRTEEKLRPVVRTPGYNVAGLCLNVLAE